MPYYPQTILTSSKLKASRYPDKTLFKDVRLPGGVTLAAGQILYETSTVANEVQTVTIGGTPSGGSFSLLIPSARGYDVIGPVNYSATGATFLSNLQAALDAYFGPSQVQATGPASGVFTLTYSGSLVAGVDAPIPTAVNNLTGTTPTVAVAQTTNGSGGIGFYEPYTAGSYSSTTNISFAVLESNTRTAANGAVVDEHGQTSKLAVPAIICGFFQVADGAGNALLAGLDTSILPNGGGVLGKFVTGGWVSGALLPGSEVYIR